MEKETYEYRTFNKEVKRNIGRGIRKYKTNPILYTIENNLSMKILRSKLQKPE